MNPKHTSTRTLTRRTPILAAAASLLLAPGLFARTPKAVDPATIKAKVSFNVDEEFAVEFDRDGDRLTNPSKSKEAEAKQPSVKVKLGVTSASPVPPPREGAKRQFLSVENNFEKTLHFCALVRMQGGREFVELTEDMKPIPAGETFNMCWGFDSQVEEVVLYEFKLSVDPPAKQPNKKNDTIQLQGEWAVTSMEIDGELQKDFQGRKLVVKGDVWNEGGKRPLVGDEHKYKMARDAAKTPKQLDLTINLGGNDETRRGIYKIEGETMTFCYSTGERPTEFKSGSDAVLVVYKRTGKK